MELFPLNTTEFGINIDSNDKDSANQWFRAISQWFLIEKMKMIIIFQQTIFSWRNRIRNGHSFEIAELIKTSYWDVRDEFWKFEWFDFVA
jgi:hypothetical protein